MLEVIKAAGAAETDSDSDTEGAKTACTEHEKTRTNADTTSDEMEYFSLDCITPGPVNAAEQNSESHTTIPGGKTSTPETSEMYMYLQKRPAKQINSSPPDSSEQPSSRRRSCRVSLIK